MSDWRNRAACVGQDPELWFPIGNTGPALLQIEDAKAVCRRCDVADQCLQWALETGQDAGVWGAMSEDERRALKRRTQRANRSGTSPGTHGGARRMTPPETRTRALARYQELRPAYPSEKATHRAVADEVGVHITTVTNWVRAAAETADAETGRS